MAEESNTNINNDKEENNLNVSFTEMLETPYKDIPKTTKKRKAINSKALIVKKEVFPTKTTTKVSKPKNIVSKTKDQGDKIKPKESWYCKVCRENVEKDMRLCSVSLVYFHEECVGLTKADKIVFVCPDCG
ncbi:unnamed protein product [Brassicogethes aeneus]|uniref:Zinc finger PHD-type domain-containing protein n=1 Tax=Brassicogethes aeneus TaxID=1431903 RepID=A0A9P0B008_BRAAE|nr:unnamed protein product [Brassicogethes aeneus]